MLDNDRISKGNPYSNYLNSLSEAEKKKLGLVKRLLEIYTGNERLRNTLNIGIPIENIDKNFKGSGISLNDVMPVIDSSIIPSHFSQKEIKEKWPLVGLWLDYIDAAKAYRKYSIEIGSNYDIWPEFDKWRRRNINRVSIEMGAKSVGIIHPPIAFELSDGCSVGCWFCGISAEKFKGHFELTPENLREWKAIVNEAYSLLGSSMESSFLYWATDPLDNPDYLEFLETYTSIVDAIPQTTTAIALKNVDLTKSVLKFWEDKKTVPNRFSVLTTSILEKIHSNFNDEELLGVELVLQNQGALFTIKSASGKALINEDEKVFFSESKKKKFESVDGGSTIACVSGFLINIVTKSIKLVSPTIANDIWPNGYIIFDEAKYDSPDQISKFMKSMISKSSLEINAKKAIKIVANVELQFENGMAFLKTPNLKREIKCSEKFIEYCNSGSHTPVDIVLMDDNKIKNFHLINFLWDNGLVET